MTDVTRMLCQPELFEDVDCSSLVRIVLPL